MYLFELWFPLDICPVAVLLGYMVGLFLVFKGISILFSIVAVPVYISTNTVGGFLFSPEETIIQKDTCTPMFITAFRLLPWKQSKCPTDEWIKMWPFYTMEYYSVIKTELNNVICSNMDATRDYHTK